MVLEANGRLRLPVPLARVVIPLARLETPLDVDQLSLREIQTAG